VRAAGEPLTSSSVAPEADSELRDPCWGVGRCRVVRVATQRHRVVPRSGISDGLDRKQATMLAFKGCARAMYQSWGVIGIGLSVFSLSPFGRVFCPKA
jgi:hypothetical protein